MNTKKISWLGLSLFAAVALASCDNIEESLSKPVTNPQEPIFNAATVTYASEPNINLSNPAEKVKVATYTVEGLPEGFTMGGTFELSPTEDFAKTIEVPMTSDESSLYVDGIVLADEYSAKFTKNPKEVTLYGRAILTAADGAEVVRIGTTTDEYYGVGEYAFTPAYVAPIADVYYVLTGKDAAWDYGAAIKMTHSENNQYDDPYFTAIVSKSVDAADKWLVLSEDSYNSAVAAGSLKGVEYFEPVYDRTDNGITYGDLEVKTSGDFNVSLLPGIGTPCEIKVDMESKNYTSKAAIENYYATGDGWSNWGEHWMPLSTTNYTNYYGFLNIGSKFKFSPNPAWDGDFGAATAPEETEKDGIYTFKGKCHDGDKDIEVGHEGLYFAHLNGVTWEYSLQQIRSWGLVGVFNDWNGDVEMTPSADLYTWTAELTVEAGQGWKFRANGGWDVNLGGKPNELWNNGDNIVLEAGTYTITLDLSTYPSKYTAVKK